MISRYSFVVAIRHIGTRMSWIQPGMWILHEAGRPPSVSLREGALRSSCANINWVRFKGSLHPMVAHPVSRSVPLAGLP